MSIYFILNGSIHREGERVLAVDNRSFRYGDGLFETMKAVNGKILLKELHFQRLFAGMEVLHFDLPGYLTPFYLEDMVRELCKKNLHDNTARIRLTVFRGNGGLTDSANPADFIIQTWSIIDDRRLNVDGLVIDVYPHARKSCDSFSNLKSNNFLSYVMAALHAKKHNMHDCLLLNTHERICDSTIANIFIIKDEIIYTPSLSEGCVAGVIRRWMLERSKFFPFQIIEKAVTIDEICNADEVFLTNSIQHIRWVKQLGNSKYQNKAIQLIQQSFNENIF
jgi:branched-chain amino acid aminotransferase